jgi:hypothetical protein
MATLTVVTLPGSLDYDGSAAVTGANLSTGTTPDDFPASGFEFVRLENTGTASQDVTITGPADPYGRTKDCVVTVGAAEVKYAGPFARTGWMNTSGDIEIVADGGTVACEVIKFPQAHSG